MLFSVPSFPRHASSPFVTAVYVMLDTLDKGKKAYDGEAGECVSHTVD